MLGFRLLDPSGSNPTTQEAGRFRLGSSMTDIGPRSTAPTNGGAFSTPASQAKFYRDQFNKTLIEGAPKIVLALSNNFTEFAKKNAATRKKGGELLDSLSGGISSALDAFNSGVGSAQLGFMGLQMRGLAADRSGLKGKPTPGRGELSFAESGSAESFRQQARIRNAKEEKKLDQDRNLILKNIEDRMAKNPLALAFAGLLN